MCVGTSEVVQKLQMTAKQYTSLLVCLAKYVFIPLVGYSFGVINYTFIWCY